MSYSKLPNELKLEIWGYALPKEATIHRLKIDMPSTDRGPDDQVMKVSPVKATKKDAPLWREFWNFSAVDITARAVAAPEKRLTVWQPDEAKANRLKALADSAKGDKARLRYTTKVTIDADRDVVHFKFTCDLFDPYLPRQLNQGLFTGIKRVAVDWKVITRGYKEFQPFQCFCSAGMQNRHPLCHYSMGQWLSYFKDVEVFYLVLKLTRKEINEKGMLRACERRFNAKYRKRLVDPMLRNTLRGWFERKLESMEKRKQLMQRPAAAVISQWNDHFRRKCFPQHYLPHL